MGKTNWTEPQKDCINARGGTVLVSAAAGSGKTAVLIERIVSLITDREAPLDIDRLLVVTFTKAAAAEMRARLNTRLAAELAEDPHNRHLLRQQMLLPQASICTIDSFCAQLLREQAQQVGVSPRFRVGDDTALKLMKNEIARRVVDEAHAAADPAFTALCNTVAGDRSDTRLVEQLLHTYEFIQAHPFPLQWLDRQQAQFEQEGPITDTVWGQLLLSGVRRDLEAAAAALETATEEMADDDRIQAAYGGSISLSLSQILHALETMGGDWDTIVRAVNAIPFERVKPLRGYEDELFKKHIAALRDQAKSLVESASSALDCSEEEARRDIANARPLVQALFDLVRRFTVCFREAKDEQTILDFNDMEHLVLSLLASPNEDGTFTRTEAAKEIGARFSHIMVDEYQDTNATQDTLFSALSDNEQNLFFVGDIKQSIYGFRQAMPAIFRGRREHSTPYNGISFPASITLGNNFRSRKQVTDSVNFLFRKLMGEQTGGIVYDEREALVSSAAFEAAEDTTFDTELLIAEKKASAEGLSAHQIEARLIGEQILTMLREGFQVSEKGALRRATLRDMCILLRSTSRTAPVFVRELQTMGIPVATGSQESFFDCAEIRLVLSILRTIDNPLLDIPMLGTLLSPAFGFSPDDLAAIRAEGKDMPLYTAMRRIARQTTSQGKRANAFLQTLERYRTLSASLPADRLIRRIYEDFDLLPVMGARSGGTGRIANLRRLYDLARRFEDRDFRGLSAFVRHMDRLEEDGIAIPTASKNNDSQNAVKLMTIHRSKGLEFPIVFLAGLASDFNTASIREDVLLHAEYGLGMVHRDREQLVERNPFHRRAIAEAITHSERTEELRVLYVAMTRAKDKLFLLATVDRLQPTLERLSVAADSGDKPLSPATVLHAARMSDWILSAMLSHKAGQPLRDAMADITPQSVHADHMIVRIVTPCESAVETLDEVLDDAPSLPAAMRERLYYRYPYETLGQIAAKVTASAVAEFADEEHDFTPERPSFMSKGGLTPAERGTATHLFLEHVDLASSLSVREQAEQMVQKDRLTDKQRDALSIRKLERFLQSPIAARMAASPLLLREFPFAVERPVTEFVSGDTLPPDARGETVLVQGIVDAAFEEHGELVIVDYKTDRVTSGEELVSRYRPQLEIYKTALSRALQRPVRRCVIYSFHLGTSIDLD